MRRIMFFRSPMASTMHSYLQARDLRAAWAPFIVAVIEATRTRSPAIHAAPSAFCHASPTLGMTPRARAPCALQLRKSSSLVVVRLLDAALYRTRRYGAGGCSSGSMEHRGERVPRDHRVQPMCVLALVAMLQRCRRGLTADLADQRLALGGPSAGANVGQLGAAGERLGSSCTRVFVKARLSVPARRGPRRNRATKW